MTDNVSLRKWIRRAVLFGLGFVFVAAVFAAVVYAYRWYAFPYEYITGAKWQEFLAEQEKLLSDRTENKQEQ